MKKILFLSAILLSLTSSAFAVEETFPSTFRDPIDGATLPELNNFHVISTEKELPGMVLRGSSPLESFMNPDDLLPLMMKRVKPTHILIFRKENSGAGTVKEEIAELEKNFGFKPVNLESPRKTAEYLHVPFRWMGVGTYAETCGMMIDGLRFIRRAASKADGRVLMHCTAGEDRTGLLSGVYRLLFQKGKYSLHDVFRGSVAGLEHAGDAGEMCSRGFAFGNHSDGKLAPFSGGKSIAKIVDDELGPYLVKFAFLIDEGALTLENLDQAKATVCTRDPATDAVWKTKFKANPKYDWSRDEYRCP